MVAENNSTNPVADLLGPKLHTGGGNKTGTSFATKPTKELVRDKDFVALYFSASWCPPCQTFSPILIDFYKRYSAKHKFEIVYISSDRNLNEFNEYYSKMPWLAIPSDAGSAKIKQELATKLQIRGIPALVVLDGKSGLFVSGNDTREQIQKLKMDDEQAVKDVISSWQNCERVSLEEGGSKMSSDGRSLIMKLIFAVLKNPMYIFGLLYFIKLGMRKFKELTNGDDSSNTDGGAGEL